MSQSEPIIILILNEHAEEIKRVSISLRGFFQDLRIDVAYSAEEAARMVPAAGNEWAIILIDEAVLVNTAPSFVADLKRRASYASVILFSERTETTAAVEALDMGVDFFLYKQSPAFLTELLFCTKEAIGKRDWRLSADRTESRHSWLLSSVEEVFYELDSEGRFLGVSRNAPALLGYHPDELIGRPYHALLPETEQPLARFRFNERRASARAVNELEMTLQGRPTPSGATFVTAAISARGMYDLSRRFVGTIGLIRDLSERHKRQAVQQELRQQIQRTDDLRALVQQITELSKGLREPLSILLQESKLLSETLRESRLIERLNALTGEAGVSMHMAEELARLARGERTGHTINQLLEDVLASEYPTSDATGAFLVEFAPTLPQYEGDREQTIRFFRHLLAYAGSFLRAAGRARVLAIKTGVGGMTGVADAPTLFPIVPAGLLTVEILETDLGKSSAWSPEAGSHDLSELYRLAESLSARLDISAPAVGPFHMMVRLPSAPVPIRTGEPAAEDPARPVAEPTPAPQRPPDVHPVPGFVRTERRSHLRVSTTLPAKVAMGSSAWEGTVVNLSVGGACILMAEHFPSIALQEVRIAVNTSVGILELSGLVYQRTTAAGALPSIRPDAYLILAFNQTPQTEAAVLASLIAAAGERSLLFAFDIRLAVAPMARPDIGPRLPLELGAYDRRETVRIPLSLAARLETTGREEPANRLEAQVTNLSRSGMCVLIQQGWEDLQGRLRIHFAPAHRSERGLPEPGAPDAALPAQVIWLARDPTALSALYAPETVSAARAGLRFSSLTPYAERELNRVLRQHMRAQRTGEAVHTSSPVVSVPRECRNARGQAIAITDDHLRQLTDGNRPVIIIAPGYGQAASDYTALAYYLAEHHFRVLRYDPTNHLGNSEGELQYTTMRSMQHDLDQVTQYVGHTWPQAPVVLIASDLGARAALKAAVDSRTLALLLLINPAIDVTSLLLAVHGHDLVADYRFGLRRGVCNLLGLNVNVDQFVGDLVAGHYADLESTLEDFRLIRAPVCIATSPAAATVPPTDLPHAFMTVLGPAPRLMNISAPPTGQQLDVQGAAPAAFKQLLKEIASVVPVQALSAQEEISAQPFIAQQHRIEQEYTFLRHDGSQVSREALCTAHITQLSQLGNLHEYRKLLDDLYGLMSPLDSGAVLVDAGIGQSDLTRAALVNHTYRAGHASWTGRPAPLMIGIGRSRERITPARHAVLVLQRELATGFIGRLSAMPPLATAWVQADWMNDLPFKTGSVSRMVCNLSLSYVPSPLAALREWHRVLHPEGSLILTTFHPETDLSPMYRRLLRQANQDEFSAHAQPLLHHFARLREAIRHRIIHTFEEEALGALLTQCGIASFRILPIFDGQAFVAIVGKQNSSGSRR
jgi:PAS domain S-box-containing protein